MKGFGMSAESLRHCFEVLNKAAREGVPGARECALGGPTVAQAGVRWRIPDPEALKLPLSHVRRSQALTPRAVPRRTALVVDDQRGLRTVVRQILEGNGFQVAEARSSEEALSLLDRARDQFDLLVTAIRMPGMTGRDLAARVRYRHTETRVLFISGSTDDPSIQAGILPPQSRFLAKPFGPEQFLVLIRDLMA